MQLATYIARAIATLKTAHVDNPSLDARLVVAHGLGLDRAQLLSAEQRVLTTSEQAALDALIARRAKREPVARIIGSREFWSLPFALNEATLEPRPDTETVVEAVLALRGDAKHILDLGTGSGCLLLSLLHDMPAATGLGIDINPRAVEQAQQNATALGLDKRAFFRTGDWLSGITETFDVIVSNPPYIPAADIPTLMPEVRAHDPLRALDGGTDGLDPYRLLIPHLPAHLNSNGLAAVEIGIHQAPVVTLLFHQAGFTTIKTHQDLGGIERCVTAIRS